jgi:lipid-binding SYLF domain-containing protein
MKKIAVGLLFLVSTAAWAGNSAARSADIERIQSASTILAQIMDAPDKAIPDSIMSGAKCIAIVPSNLKIGFIFGANYGKGVATCRTATGWSSPVFFRMTGGSFGFQAGGQASDLVLIIRTAEGMQHMLQSKFKLGADASASAGPVGRDAQAATDLTMRAQVLTYSRSRGLFLGVSLAGAVIRQDYGDTMAFYGKDYTFYSVLAGEVPPPQDSQLLLKTVEQYAPTRRAAMTHPVTPVPTTAAPAPAAAPASTTVPAPVATPSETPAETPATTPSESAAPTATEMPEAPAEVPAAPVTKPMTTAAAQPTPGSPN